MGAIGAGKCSVSLEFLNTGDADFANISLDFRSSAFSKVLIEKTSVPIGDSLESENADMEVIRFIDDVTDRKVTIVGALGFDDFRQGVIDSDILKMVANFLFAE